MEDVRVREQLQYPIHHPKSSSKDGRNTDARTDEHALRLGDGRLNVDLEQRQVSARFNG